MHLLTYYEVNLSEGGLDYFLKVSLINSVFVHDVFAFIGGKINR